MIKEIDENVFKRFVSDFNDYFKRFENCIDYDEDNDSSYIFLFEDFLNVDSVNCYNKYRKYYRDNDKFINRYYCDDDCIVFNIMRVVNYKNEMINCFQFGIEKSYDELKTDEDFYSLYDDIDAKIELIK